MYWIDWALPPPNTVHYIQYLGGAGSFPPVNTVHYIQYIILSTLYTVHYNAVRFIKRTAL